MLDGSTRTWIFSAISLVAACAAEPPTGPTEPMGLGLVSAGGITVTATRWISARTIEVDITAPLVAPVTVKGPHRIRLTLPNDCVQNPIARYPALYLLHGGAGENSAQWTTGVGDAEDITVGLPVVVVMPDGGKVGWFTNWVASQIRGERLGAHIGERQGSFGIRRRDGKVAGEQRFASLPGYTLLRIMVDAEESTSLVVYAGTWAAGDTWIQVDDVSIIAL